jgi:hypothetical protein
MFRVRVLKAVYDRSVYVKMLTNLSNSVFVVYVLFHLAKSGRTTYAQLAYDQSLVNIDYGKLCS